MGDRPSDATRNRSVRRGGERGRDATGHETCAGAAHLKSERTTHACARKALWRKESPCNENKVCAGAKCYQIHSSRNKEKARARTLLVLSISHTY